MVDSLKKNTGRVWNCIHSLIGIYFDYFKTTEKVHFMCYAQVKYEYDQVAVSSLFNYPNTNII